MIVLGIAAGSFEGVDEVKSRGLSSHDSSATLVKDGRILAASEEERFTRYKHMNRSEAVHFARQQLGDEKSAEQEKHRHAEVAEQANVVQPEVPRRINGR